MDTVDIPGYRIERVIGEGGMSIVYLAVQESLDRQIALKVMSPALGSDKTFRDRFLKEGRIVAKLAHRNIVTVYDIGEIDSTLFMAMQYLPGTNVAELIHRGLTVSRALEIVKDVAEALHYAHRLGFVHRDVKPGNIGFTEDDIPVLMDFGIAKLLDQAEGFSTMEATQVGMAIGTPGYMSPEQAMGQPLTWRSDLYSLGVVFFEMLTGNKPFTGESVVSVVMKHVQEPVPRLPTELAPLQHIVDTLMAKQAEERYADAGALLEDLRHLDLSTLPLDRKPISGDLAAAVATTMHTMIVSTDSGPAAPDAGSRPKGHPGLGGRMLGWLASLVSRASERPGTTPSPGAAPLPESTSAGAAPQPGPPAGPVDGTVFQPRPSQTAMQREAVPSPPAVPYAEDATCFFPESAAPKSPDAHDVSLIVTRCADPALFGRRIPLTAFPFRVGRNKAADLAISSDSGLSGEHLILEHAAGSIMARDEGSTNGTYINGRLLPPGTASKLMLGDNLRLSETTTLTLAMNAPLELPDLTGQRVAGRFRLSRILHQSAKAAVYAAQDEQIPKTWAIKVLSQQLVGFPGYREQLFREAETAAKLSHPFICKVFDFGETEIALDSGGTVTLPYWCMELMNGDTMSDVLQKKKAVPLAQVAQWLSTLGDALDYAHRQGVVHSGIKPTSVVFDQEGNPYLTDFAIASRTDDSQGHTLSGAPAFLAPEQWDDKTPTAATDQYSLAVLIYWLVTGGKPYEGQEYPEVRRRNYSFGPIPAHEEAARNGRVLPEAVSTLLSQALSTEAAERFATVNEFAEAFTQALRPDSASAAVQPRVFISYRREPSAGWAIHFKSELEGRHDISVYIDTQTVDNAVHFPARLQRAIEGCDVFICLLAEDTLESNWVNQEIKIAHASRKPMIPVFQESFQPAELGRDIQPHVTDLLDHDCVHLLDRRNIHVAHTIDELAKIIRGTSIGSKIPQGNGLE